MPVEGAYSGRAGGQARVTPPPNPWAFVKNLPVLQSIGAPPSGIGPPPVYYTPAASQYTAPSGGYAAPGIPIGGGVVPVTSSYGAPAIRAPSYASPTVTSTAPGGFSLPAMGMGGAVQPPSSYAQGTYGYGRSPYLTLGGLGSAFGTMRRMADPWLEMAEEFEQPGVWAGEMGKALMHLMAGKRYTSPYPMVNRFLSGNPSVELIKRAAIAGATAQAELAAALNRNPEIAAAPALFGQPAEQAAPPAAPPAPFEGLISPGGVPGIQGPAGPSLLQRLGQLLGIGAAAPPTNLQNWAQSLGQVTWTAPTPAGPAPPTVAPPVSATVPPTRPPTVAAPRTGGGGGGGGGYGGGGAAPTTSIEGLPAPWVTNFEAVFGPIATYYTPERGGIEQATRDYQTLQALWLQATGKYLTPEELPGLWAMIRPYLATLGRAPTMADVIGWLTSFLKAKAKPPQVSYLDVEEI